MQKAPERNDTTEKCKSTSLAAEWPNWVYSRHLFDIFSGRVAAFSSEGWEVTEVAAAHLLHCQVPVVGLLLTSWSEWLQPAASLPWCYTSSWAPSSGWGFQLHLMGVDQDREVSGFSRCFQIDQKPCSRFGSSHVYNTHLFHLYLGRKWHIKPVLVNLCLML